MTIQLGEIKRITASNHGEDAVDIEFKDGSIFVGFRGQLLDSNGQPIGKGVKNYFDEKNQEVYLALAEVTAMLAGGTNVP